jgi:hypothetical protein
MPIMTKLSEAIVALGGSGKRSLPMVCPFTIGKAFGLAAATRRDRSDNSNDTDCDKWKIRHDLRGI